MVSPERLHVRTTIAEVRINALPEDAVVGGVAHFDGDVKCVREEKIKSSRIVYDTEKAELASCTAPREQTLKQQFSARGVTTFLLSHRSIHIATRQKTFSGHRRVQGTRRVSAVNSPPKERNSPESLSFGRSLPITDRWPSLATGTLL